MSSYKPLQVQIMHGSRPGAPVVWLAIPHDRQDWVLGSDGEIWILDHLEGTVLAEWSGLELRVGFALQSDADLFTATLWPESRTPKW